MTRSLAALSSAWLAALPLLAGACTSTKPYDYGRYLDHMPRSIIVLPPLDETPSVDACYGYLATVTRPLAERGYYVFPVALVDRMLRENGLPTPGEMHQAPAQKLREVFGADAVLYLNVKHWGTSYQVLNSVTSVEVEGQLIDLESGTELWSGSKSAESDSSSGQSGLAGMLTAAVINQLATAIDDPTPGVARQANADLFDNENDGLLPGPHHPQFEQTQKALRRARGEADAQPAPAPATGAGS